jgi:hypothetical protein
MNDFVDDLSNNYSSVVLPTLQIVKNMLSLNNATLVTDILRDSEYDYHLSKRKAELIMKYYKILLDVYGSKIDIKGLREIGNIKRKCKFREVGYENEEKCEKHIEEVIKNSGRSVSEDNRKTMLIKLC